MDNLTHNDFGFDMKVYMDALIIGNRKKCLEIIKEYINFNNNPTRLYEEVIKESLYRVGEMWETNEISVATEHLATSISESLLNHVYQSIDSTKKIEKKIIIAGTEKEIHQVGIKMVAELFERSGWETFFLGSNVALKDLIRFIKTTKPDLLGLSLCLNHNLPIFEKNLSVIRENFPNLQIIVGGRAFLSVGIEIFNKFNKISYIADLYALELYIKNHEEHN